jgi:alkanesulfonate monooxygenase SsuD/methylene tetrahydromethanopterin reductase-like flavin-dependent oxidoreductase (luciferase family)
MSDSAPERPPWVTHPWVAQSASEIQFGIAEGPRNDWPALAEFVAALEDLEFDSYWRADHPLPSADCWTTLAGLATITKRLRLGTSVACTAYRNPALLARMASDVDRMSQGRLVLGVGMGDFEWEFAQMGIPYPSVRERQETLEETIGIVRALWGDVDTMPPSKHFAVTAPPLQPGPIQQPRVPLLIAGGGQRVTLRQVAQYADASNFGEHVYTGGVEGTSSVQARLDALRSHCDAFGRPYDSVLRTHFTYPLVIAESSAAVTEKIERLIPPRVVALAGTSIVAGTPADAIAFYARLARLGLQYFIVAVYDLETAELLAEHVIPEVRSRYQDASRRDLAPGIDAAG